jgi:pyruvate dehydrogenase complex dehydrogenase (E1) component
VETWRVVFQIHPAEELTHIATQEQLNGKVVDWMEKISDEQYQAHKANQ